MTVFFWIVAVAIALVAATWFRAWRSDHRRQRVIDRDEQQRDVGFPERTRLGDRRQVPHDSDGGRP